MPGKPKKPAAKKKPARTTRICSLCGSMKSCAEGGIPNGWTITVDGRTGVEYMCDDCARRNIRAIEGKLPEEWWE